MSDGDLVPRPPADLGPAIGLLAQRARRDLARRRPLRALVICGDPMGTDAWVEVCKSEAFLAVGSWGLTKAWSLVVEHRPDVILLFIYGLAWRDIFADLRREKPEVKIMIIGCPCRLPHHEAGCLEEGAWVAIPERVRPCDRGITRFLRGLRRAHARGMPHAKGESDA